MFKSILKKTNKITDSNLLLAVTIFGLSCLAATAHIQQLDNDMLRADILTSFESQNELRSEIKNVNELLNNLQRNITEKYAPHPISVDTNLTYLSDGFTNSVTE